MSAKETSFISPDPGISATPVRTGRSPNAQLISEPGTVEPKVELKSMSETFSMTKDEDAKPPRTKRKKREAGSIAKSGTSKRKKEVAEIPLTEEQEEQMREKAALIEAKLEKLYPKAPEGFLDHTDSFTLLVAVVLSAQCTDAKVNAVTPGLFAAASTPAAMVALGEAHIRELIKQIGLTNSKARYLHGLSTALVERHGGIVPADMSAMEQLPGVGHKTASVVAAQAFGIPAFPVDTHIHRLACRWGIGDKRSVERTEAALKRWFPRPHTWISLHTRIIAFGREYCPAKRHDMDACPVCSFAATVEARAANARSVTKFIAPDRHKNPFSIRSDEKGPLGPVRETDQGPEVVNNSSTANTNTATTAPETRTLQFRKRKIVMKNSESTGKSESKRGRPARGISKSASASAGKKEKKPGRPKSSKAKPKVDESGLRRSTRIKEQQKN